MLIGIPREIKVHEYRVGMTPSAVREAVMNGHQVLAETGAGKGIGCDDSDYIKVGAGIASTAAEVFKQADMVVKVKEPQPNECAMLRDGQLLFTYLHLAPDPKQAELLLRSGCTAIAYETVADRNGALPLLAPMSEVAGRMSIQVGAIALQKASGGRGILLGGVPGVLPARVVILGGGISGTQAAQMAVGMGADVTILDKSLPQVAGLSPETHFNVVKLHQDGHQLSLLDYSSFFDDPFPPLARSWRVSLSRNTIIFRTYEESRNPPILHRKGLLLSPDDPNRPGFAAITDSAEAIGLFSDPNRIGFREYWYRPYRAARAWGEDGGGNAIKLSAPPPLRLTSSS